MVQLKSLSEQVYDYVLRQIRLGALLADDKISETKIAEELNTSRTPVREALLALADDGILVNGKRRGFTVKRVTRDEMNKKFHVLSRLEALAAELAVDKVGEAHLKDMQTYIDRMDLAVSQQDYGFYYESQNAFHNVYVEICGNEYLIQMIDELEQSLVRTTVLTVDKEELFKRLSEFNDEHREILKLLKEGKKEELTRLIETHFYSPEKDVEETLF